jgi:hypothetical protein
MFVAAISISMKTYLAEEVSIIDLSTDSSRVEDVAIHSSTS